MNEIVIKSATIDDIDEIQALEISYQEEVYSREEIIKMFSFDYYIFLIAKIGDETVGYLCATIVCDECELLKIIVDNNYRKMGIGKKLIEKLVDICKDKKCKSVFLEVNETNLNAIKFYEKNNFMFLSKRPRYYNGQDALIFRKSIE